jgi:hypothetical protein
MGADKQVAYDNKLHLLSPRTKNPATTRHCKQRPLKKQLALLRMVMILRASSTLAWYLKAIFFAMQIKTFSKHISIHGAHQQERGGKRGAGHRQH